MHNGFVYKRTVNLMKCQQNRDKLCGPIQIENKLDHGYSMLEAIRTR